MAALRDAADGRRRWRENTQHGTLSDNGAVTSPQGIFGCPVAASGSPRCHSRTARWNGSFSRAKAQAELVELEASDPEDAGSTRHADRVSRPAKKYMEALSPPMKRDLGRIGYPLIPVIDREQYSVTGCGPSSGRHLARRHFRLTIGPSVDGSARFCPSLTGQRMACLDLGVETINVRLQKEQLQVPVRC